jgi:hypothetical protein
VVNALCSQDFTSPVNYFLFNLVARRAMTERIDSFSRPLHCNCHALYVGMILAIRPSAAILHACTIESLIHFRR